MLGSSIYLSFSIINFLNLSIFAGISSFLVVTTSELCSLLQTRPRYKEPHFLRKSFPLTRFSQFMLYQKSTAVGKKNKIRRWNELTVDYRARAQLSNLTLLLVIIVQIAYTKKVSTL